MRSLDLLPSAAWLRPGTFLMLLFLVLATPTLETARAASVTEQASELGQDISRTAHKTWVAVENKDPRKLSAGQILGLLIVGVLVGALAGMVLTKKPKGFGLGKNLLLGLLGAFLGSVIVDAFKINFGWGAVVIGYEETATAFAAAILCVLAGRSASSLWNRAFKGGKTRAGATDKKDK